MKHGVRTACATRETTTVAIRGARRRVGDCVHRALESSCISADVEICQDPAGRPIPLCVLGIASMKL